MSQNQERAAKEKADHLERDLRKAEQRKQQQGADEHRTAAISSEYQKEREDLLIDLQDKQNDLLQQLETNKQQKREIEEKDRKIKE